MKKDIKNKKKEIEVITGDGTELDLSPVFEHLNSVKPKAKTEECKKGKIIIPGIKKK